MLTYLGFGDFRQRYFFGSWSDLGSERLTHKLRYWAKEVISAGQQLEVYGRWEHERIVSANRAFSTCSGPARRLH